MAKATFSSTYGSVGSPLRKRKGLAVSSLAAIAVPLADLGAASAGLIGKCC